MGRPVMRMEAVANASHASRRRAGQVCLHDSRQQQAGANLLGRRRRRCSAAAAVVCCRPCVLVVLLLPAACASHPGAQQEEEACQTGECGAQARLPGARVLLGARALPGHCPGGCQGDRRGGGRLGGARRDPPRLQGTWQSWPAAPIVSRPPHTLASDRGFIDGPRAVRARRPVQSPPRRQHGRVPAARLWRAPLWPTAAAPAAR